MADEPFTPEDVELVGDVLFSYLDRLGLDPQITRPYGAAKPILAALAAAGRLRDPEATVIDEWTEWATEHSNHRVPNLPDPFINEASRQGGQRLAEVRLSAWSNSHPHASHRLMSRLCLTVVGPWLPAEPKEQ